MADTDEIDSGKAALAPYTAYQSIKTLLGQLKANGIPDRIDRSVLTNFSGAVASQVLTALKFLDLTDQGGNTTPLMRKLVEALDTDRWPGELAKVLQHSYAPLFKMNLETVTSSQFNEAFRTAYPGADDSSRKAVTFFLNAVREAEIKVSHYLMKNKKPRSGPTKRRTKAANGVRTSENSVVTPPPPPAPVKSAYDVLMQDIYDPKAMKPNSDEEKAVFTLARYLKIKELME